MWKQGLPAHAMQAGHQQSAAHQPLPATSFFFPKCISQTGFQSALTSRKTKSKDAVEIMAFHEQSRGITEPGMQWAGATWWTLQPNLPSSHSLPHPHPDKFLRGTWECRSEVVKQVLQATAANLRPPMQVAFPMA